MSFLQIHTLELPAKTWRLGKLREFCLGILRPHDFEAKICHQVILAIDEAAANIIEHAFPSKNYEGGTFQLQIEVGEETIKVEFRDFGLAFNPPLLSPSEINKIKFTKRGYGLKLIQKIMDEVTYERTDQGENILTLVKCIKLPQYF